MDSFKKRILTTKQAEELGLNNDKYLQIEKEAWRLRGEENIRDKEIYAQFRKLAREGKEENDNRFRMKYIWNLNLKWNILILLGKKNIGKTYQIFQLMREAIAEGREVVLVRNSVKECITALQPLFDEDSSPVRVVSRKNNTFDIVIRGSDYEEDEEGNLKRKKPVKVGFCCSISTLTSYQGASYEKVKYIIWDECIDDGSNMNSRVTPTSLRQFERFISSIVRDKLDVKVLMFGNLLEKISGIAGDPVLDFYGINVECGCKYIQASKEGEANILYINTKEMFKGIDKQGVIGGVDSLTSRSLLTNTSKPKGLKIVSYSTFLDCKPYRCLVFTYESKNVVIYINESPYKDIQRHLVVYISALEETKIHSQAYTNEAALYNNLAHIVDYVDNETWGDMLEELHDYCVGRRVYYVGEQTGYLLNVYMKHFSNLIENNKKKVDWSGSSKWD